MRWFGKHFFSQGNNHIDSLFAVRRAGSSAIANGAVRAATGGRHVVDIGALQVASSVRGDVTDCRPQGVHTGGMEPGGGLPRIQVSYQLANPVADRPG